MTEARTLNDLATLTRLVLLTSANICDRFVVYAVGVRAWLGLVEAAADTSLTKLREGRRAGEEAQRK